MGSGEGPALIHSYRIPRLITHQRRSVTTYTKKVFDWFRTKTGISNQLQRMNAVTRIVYRTSSILNLTLKLTLKTNPNA